ncbi:MAG TPA: LPS assembly lipoprotein LptE [Azospirillum sp.]
MPTRRSFLLTATAAVSLALAACQSTPPRVSTQPIGFTQFGPIVLNAAAIDVVDNHRPMGGGGKHVEQSAPTPPAEAVRRWTAERLQTNGRPGRVRVTIRDAAIIETQLPKTGGVQGYFTNDQAQRYDGRLEVEVSGESSSPDGSSFRGVTKSTVTASATVAENVSLADREATLQELTRRMADQLNARLDAGIRKDLAPMVVR